MKSHELQICIVENACKYSSGYQQVTRRQSFSTFKQSYIGIITPYSSSVKSNCSEDKKCKVVQNHHVYFHIGNSQTSSDNCSINTFLTKVQ